MYLESIGCCSRNRELRLTSLRLFFLRGTNAPAGRPAGRAPIPSVLHLSPAAALNLYLVWCARPLAVTPVEEEEDRLMPGVGAVITVDDGDAEACAA